VAELGPTQGAEEHHPAGGHAEERFDGFDMDPVDYATGIRVPTLLFTGEAVPRVHRELRFRRPEASTHRRSLRRLSAFERWLGILDDYRTFWIDPEEGAIEEFEYLMAGK